MTSSETASMLCSDADLAAGDDPRGSAAEFTSFLLIEHRSSFGRNAAEDAVRAVYPAALAAAALALPGLRPFAIRPVGRADAAGSVIRYIGRSGPGGFLAETHNSPAMADVVQLATTGARHQGPPQSSDTGRRPTAPIAPASTVREAGPLAGWSAGGLAREPLFAVCTNGSRDRCCAVKGRDVAAQLHFELDDPDDDPTVVEISHLGGHRFAPTMLVLPWGYAYARLDVDLAQEIAYAAQDGLVHPTNLRGRADLAPAAQVADVIWRAELGPAPIDAVLITSITTEGDVQVVTGTVQGRAETQKLRRIPGQTIFTTACGGKPIPTLRWATA